jgi:Omp85 superfamily domain
VLFVQKVKQRSVLVALLWSALCLAQSISAIPPASPSADQNATAQPGGVGKSIQTFGEEVAQRVDRIIKKKAFDLWGDPWTLQGIPLVFPSSTNGFNLGLHLAFQDIRRQDPHKMEIEGQVLASDAGRYKHFIKLDIPHLLDGKFHLTTRVAYDRDIAFRYYGIGNDNPLDKAAQNSNNPLYQNVRAGPNITLEFLRNFGRNVSLGPIFGFRWTEITAPPGSLLLEQQPIGINGGRTDYLGLAFVYQTLDFAPYPTQGLSNEIFLYWYAPFLGSDYNYFRATYTFRQFIPLHRELTFAYRTLFEVLNGSVPYYELGSVGGADPTIGFGGDKFLHGFDSNRFIDKIRFTLGVELRWDPLNFIFAKQDITIGFVPLFDIGRVWDSFEHWNWGDWHASVGVGNRIIWNNRFIIRTDFAINEESYGIYVELGSAF